MENKTISWVAHAEFIASISVFIACFLFLHNQIDKLDSKIERQSSRTDKLYEMFIEIVKERKG